MALYSIYITPVPSTPTIYVGRSDDDSGASTRHHKPSLQLGFNAETAYSPTSNNLSKRITIGDDWDVYWFDGPAYLPVEAAAAFLAGFYTQVLSRAIHNDLADQPPFHRFSFRRGHIALSCYCARSPIPWAFLQMIALEMLEFSMKGYTGQYIAKFVHAGGLEINLDMAVGPQGPALPSDAFSSSSRPSRRRIQDARFQIIDSAGTEPTWKVDN